MIKLPLRSWRCVDADLVRGQLSFGPNHSMRLFNPPVKKGFFAKQPPAYVKTDRTQQHGLILRAFTQEEFRYHFVSKMVTALTPMGPQLVSTLADLTARAIADGYPVRDRALLADANRLLASNSAAGIRVFADAISPSPQDGPQDPVYAFYCFMLGSKPLDWYVDTLGGVEVEGETDLHSDYTVFRSAEMLQRIVLAHHYRVPVQSTWAQSMLVALRQDGDLSVYHTFK